MLVKERLSIGQWVPPWLRHQHEARYDWAALRAKGLRVLDGACGNGYGTETISRGGAKLAVGVEIEPEAVFERKRDAALLCASMIALPFRDATFDLVVSLETIEHIDDDRAYVAEVRRVLRREGVLICSTPNREVLNPGKRLADRPFNPFHIREYAAGELEALLRTQFGNVTLFGQTGYARPYVSFLAAIGRKLPMTAVRMHQLRKLAAIPFERRSRHEPRPLPLRHGEPEVLIAVCSES